jgi:uncharacterized protein YijF (DUF1287 family)
VRSNGLIYSFDLERSMVTFADDALVNDQLRDYWGKSAEKNRSKTAYKSYCCARDDFGRPIFCNTAYSRLEYPAGALTRESTFGS